MSYSRVGNVAFLVHAGDTSQNLEQEKGEMESLRDVKVDTDEDSLALEVDVGNAELGGEGHCVYGIGAFVWIRKKGISRYYKRNDIYSDTEHERFERG